MDAGEMPNRNTNPDRCSSKQCPTQRPPPAYRRQAAGGETLIDPRTGGRCPSASLPSATFGTSRTSHRARRVEACAKTGRASSFSSPASKGTWYLQTGRSRTSKNCCSAQRLLPACGRQGKQVCATAKEMYECASRSNPSQKNHSLWVGASAPTEALVLTIPFLTAVGHCGARQGEAISINNSAPV